MLAVVLVILKFQSTLPCGSDYKTEKNIYAENYFNPRSLAGATQRFFDLGYIFFRFQSTLPCGSDQFRTTFFLVCVKFQSTLPCGSDYRRQSYGRYRAHFNPRSLAGATIYPLD